MLTIIIIEKHGILPLEGRGSPDIFPDKIDMIGTNHIDHCSFCFGCKPPQRKLKLSSEITRVLSGNSGHIWNKLSETSKSGLR